MNSKTKKITITILILLIIGVALFFILRNNNETDPQNNNTNENQPTTEEQATISSISATTEVASTDAPIPISVEYPITGIEAIDESIQSDALSLAISVAGQYSNAARINAQYTDYKADGYYSAVFTFLVYDVDNQIIDRTRETLAYRESGRVLVPGVLNAAQLNQLDSDLKDTLVSRFRFAETDAIEELITKEKKSGYAFRIASNGLVVIFPGEIFNKPEGTTHEVLISI